MAVLWLLGVGLAADPSGEPQLIRFRFAGTEMATPVRIVLYAPEAGAADAAAEAAFARIHQLNGIFSDYDPQSEARWLCVTAGQGTDVRVSEELWNVLVNADTLAKRSDGAFDVTVGPVVLLWRQARRTGQLPPPETLSEALSWSGITSSGSIPSVAAWSY